ncbi:MAG: hypothetical protein DHS20C12_10530 [Pseudohongiella sp.]|nr:MAG: hypothetical protein DHS20C12_10530 [Pseudohongiella sp.]
MKPKSIISQSLLFGLVTSLLVALVVTTIFTTLDVIRNYGGVFSDASGTNWDRVYETALSWFFPTFFPVLAVIILGHLLFAALSAKSNKSASSEQLDTDR